MTPHFAVRPGSTLAFPFLMGSSGYPPAGISSVRVPVRVGLSSMFWLGVMPSNPVSLLN